jgi:hypothetical protein
VDVELIVRAPIHPQCYKAYFLSAVRTNFSSLLGWADLHTVVSQYIPSAGKMFRQIKFTSELLEKEKLMICVVVRDFRTGCKTPKMSLNACNQTPNL